MTLLPQEFYQREDVVKLAQDLLGKWLLTCIDGHLAGGMIIETEAYKGAEDRACHAYNNRRTKRTEVMFQKGGCAYVYLCYGMHHLFNIVTNQQDVPHAILIRALLPDIGISMMQERRKVQTLSKLAAGPGMVCQALGIDRSHNGKPLTEGPIWVEDRGKIIKSNEIRATPRIGVDYAKEHAELPWRFLLEIQS